MACDREALLDPSIQAAIDAELRAFPPVPWECDPDSHVAILNQRVREVLEKHAPARPKPRKDWIAPRTWALIRLLSQYRAEIR
eukprot:10930893-Alexandrium_andersonii.AAC.1